MLVARYAPTIQDPATRSCRALRGRARGDRDGAGAAVSQRTEPWPAAGWQVAARARQHMRTAGHPALPLGGLLQPAMAADDRHGAT